MRVLLDYRAALRERSGVGEYTHQLVRALLDQSRRGLGRGLELTVFSSSAKDRLPDNPELAGAQRIDRQIPVRLLNLAWHRLEWPPIERVSGGRFDVAHSMHPLLMPSRTAAQVVTIYDLNFLAHPERTRAEIRRDYPALVHNHARRADQIVVISQFTAAEVRRLLDVPAERISICTPGRPDWSPRDASTKGEYVLFFGTLEPRKNLGTLLDAYAALASRRRHLPELVLAGKATEHSGPWLERIGKAPLNRLVRHIGYVPAEQRRALYAGARLLVQPSYEEGFGLPVLEAMTVGVPVVGANAGAIPEVSGDAALLVPATDADAMGAAIEQLLDDASLAAQCIERGLARSAAFSWEQTASATLDAYERALLHRAHRQGAA